jgi:hypothetical protein
MSFTRVSALSSPTWRGRPSASSPSTNQRGTAEQWIKEGKEREQMDPASCRTFAANAVRLQLHALAYNLGNFMPGAGDPKTAEPWSLTSLREKLIKIGAKVVGHGRYVTFQRAEVAVSRRMFADILSLITRLRALPAPAGRALSRAHRAIPRGAVRPNVSKSGRSTLGCRQPPASIALSLWGRRFPVTRAGRSATLGSKPPGIRRMSVFLGLVMPCQPPILTPFSASDAGSSMPE